MDKVIDLFKEEVKVGDYVIYASPYRGATLRASQVFRETKDFFWLKSGRRITKVYAFLEVVKITEEQYNKIYGGN